MRSEDIDKINIGYVKDIMEVLGISGIEEMSEEELYNIYYLNLCKNTYHTLCCKETQHGEGGCDFYEKYSKSQEKWKSFVKEEAKKYNMTYEELSRSLRKCLNLLTQLKETDQSILHTILSQSQERAPVRQLSVSDSSSEGVSQLGVVPDSLSFVPDPS